MAINVTPDISKMGLPSVSFLPQDGVEALREYVNERISKGETIAPDTFVFASIGSKGRPLSSFTVYMLLHRLGILIGLPSGQGGSIALEDTISERDSRPFWRRRKYPITGDSYS